MKRQIPLIIRCLPFFHYMISVPSDARASIALTRIHLLRSGMYAVALYSFSHIVLPCIIHSFLIPDLQFHQGTWKDHSALDVCLFHAFPWSGYTLSHILSGSYCPFRIWPYISLWLLLLPLHCHFLFALLRYPQTFSVHAYDIALSYLPPRYNRHNHHSADNHGNLSGILSRFFRSFLLCGHKARYFFCCHSCSEHPDIGMLQLTAFSAICEYIMMFLIRINDILLQ